jgi:beta-lactamase class A
VRAASRIAVLAAAVVVALALVGNDAQARAAGAVTLQIPTNGALAVTGTHDLVLAVDGLALRSPASLAAAIEPMIEASGGSAGVAVIELGGKSPLAWSYGGSEVFAAASTYKLAVLMLEAQKVASGLTNPSGLVCYEDSDYEPGWFDDYADGVCLTRAELARRAGLYSDNTAGHMLVRDVGGATALNAWAASMGATGSVFFTDNTTTANDLAILWADEAKGSLGGAAAQSWLYPVLTQTATEAGIPAGVAGRSAVIHKTGTIDQVDNDAALVTAGPHGAYVVTVMTDGVGGDEGWQLVASISAAVWAYEAAR